MISGRRDLVELDKWMSKEVRIQDHYAVCISGKREVCLHEVKDERIGSCAEGVRLDLPCGHHRDALLFTQREC